MKLDVEEIIHEADILYAEAKLVGSGVDVRYMAPEQLPRIVSDQVKAMGRAIINAINRESDKSTKQLCSGFGVFPDGSKCQGCADCQMSPLEARVEKLEKYIEEIEKWSDKVEKWAKELL